MTSPDNIVRLDSARLPETKPLSALEDDELVLMARGGMKEAFDSLVRRHQQRVLCVAGKWLGHPQAARDAAQNTFLEVFLYLPRYRPRGKFKAFLHRVLLNQCRMLQRSRRYESKAREQLHAAPEWNVPDLPDEQLLAREKRREVERALGRLSKKQRNVVVLRYAAELSHEEIADVLGVPLGTVKSRLFAGLAKLRRVLEGEAE